MEELKKRPETEDTTRTFVSARGGEFGAIRDASFDVGDPEFLVLLGPRLCGKTVLLNILTGLKEATSGTIRLDNQELKDCSDKTSIVLQRLGLSSWKTVMENVEVRLRYTGVSKKERRKRVQRSTDLMGLTGFEGVYPGQPSGSMKQRVGIARAYTANPEILILDEPFDQLDAQTRYSMEDEILRTWERERRMIIFVTNNIGEAVHLGGRIIPLEKRPTSVKKIYDIDLLRPRNMTDRVFSGLRTRISDNMELSV